MATEGTAANHGSEYPSLNLPPHVHESDESLWQLLLPTLRRKWFSILGGIALLAVVGYGLTLAFAYFVQIPTAYRYADEVIPRIFTTWDLAEYQRRASPELLQAASMEQVGQTFSSLSSRLGRMTAYRGVRSGHVNNAIGGAATGWVVADVTFEHGSGWIRIEFIGRTHKGWEITSWTVKSPALMPNPPATPQPSRL